MKDVAMAIVVKALFGPFVVYGIYRFLLDPATSRVRRWKDGCLKRLLLTQVWDESVTARPYPRQENGHKRVEHR
jgi:hypothetical protein